MPFSFVEADVPDADARQQLKHWSEESEACAKDRDRNDFTLDQGGRGLSERCLHRPMPNRKIGGRLVEQERDELAGEDSELFGRGRRIAQAGEAVGDQRVATYP